MRITAQTWATFPLSVSVFFFPLSVNVLCCARLSVHTQTHCEVHWSDCLSVSQPSVHLSPVSPSAPLYCVARARCAQHSAVPSSKWLWLLRSSAPPSSSSSLLLSFFPFCFADSPDFPFPDLFMKYQSLSLDFIFAPFPRLLFSLSSPYPPALPTADLADKWKVSHLSFCVILLPTCQSVSDPCVVLPRSLVFFRLPSCFSFLHSPH